MKFAYVIWCNLKRKRARTVLTCLSIAVAFALFCLLSAIETALTQGVDVAGADRLVVRHRVSIIQTLPESYKARIARIPGVSEVTHCTWFGGIYQEPKNFFAQMPTIPEEYLSIYPEYVLPKDQFEAWQRTRTGAILGRKTAEKFGWSVGDRVPLQSPIWRTKAGDNSWEFEVVGVYDGAKKGTDTTQMFFRYDYFNENRAEGDGEVGWYVVKVADPDEAVDIAKQIEREFENSPAETKAETEGAFVGAFAKQVGDIATIMTSILGAVFFTILLVSGNTMAQSVRERVAELGVMKALGFSDGAVMWLVMAESCAIAGLGGALGLALGWLATSAGDPTGGALPLFYMPVHRFAVGAGLAAALGVVSGVVPAVRAMRLPAAEAMRRA